MCRSTISHSCPVMQFRALLCWHCSLCTWQTLPLSQPCFQWRACALRRFFACFVCFVSFRLHATLSEWSVSVRYSWCLLFASQQASQMASLKVLIDAQCLLIKKLLSLTMTVVHRDRHKHAAVETTTGEVAKKQKMTTTSTGETQHLNGGQNKKTSAVCAFASSAC